MVITERGDPSTVRDPRSSVGVSELIFPCSVSPNLGTYPSPVISLGVSCRHPFRGGNREKLRTLALALATIGMSHRCGAMVEALSVGFLWLFFLFHATAKASASGIFKFLILIFHLNLFHLVGFIVEGGRLTFHPQLKVKRQAATKIEAQLSTTHTL